MKFDDVKCSSCGGPLSANKAGQRIYMTFQLVRGDNDLISEGMSGLCGPCIEKAEAQTVIVNEFLCGTCLNHEDARCDYCGNNLPPGNYPLRDTRPKT